MGGTYQCDRIPICGQPATRRYRRDRRLPARELDDTSSSRTGMRHRLIFQRENEASFSRESLVFTVVAALRRRRCRSSRSLSSQLAASFLLLFAAATLNKQLLLSISASPRLYSSLLLT
ncbi:hypothetical protein BHE74_00056785 [Ensete ventricosum]|nr:hypothetical protein BHE74_00056785 [Ensete ventricosum]